MDADTSTENWLDERVRLTPHATALVYDGGSLCYAELAVEVRVRAKLLRGFISPAERGRDVGPRVALLAGNCVPYVLWVLACIEAEVQFVPLNVRLSVPELHEQLADCQPLLLLCDDARLPVARELVTASAANQAGALHLSEFSQAEAFLANHATACEDPYEPACRYDLGRISNIIYTSGSTGRPKGVLQTLGNHWHSAHACQDNLGFSAKTDVWGCPTPLFHMSGLSIIMRSLACGVGVRLYDRFDAQRVNDDALAGHITCLSAVTYQIERMLDELEGRPVRPSYPKSLRFVLQGGGPIPPATLERCRDAHMNTIQSFGMTETASQVISLSLEDAVLKVGSAGRPVGSTRLRIARRSGTSDEAVPAEETGHILLKGPTLAVGYLNQPYRYAESFTDNGWFDTGDLGRVDAEGYLYVTCRKADLIISGGENVYPAEVEAVVQLHPSVEKALVVGVDDAVWGSVPAAVCVPAHGVAPTDPTLPNGTALRAFCRDRLAAYKCPRHVVWVRELPYTASGKPRRPEAAALAAAALAQKPAEPDTR